MNTSVLCISLFLRQEMVSAADMRYLFNSEAPGQFHFLIKAVAGLHWCPSFRLEIHYESVSPIWLGLAFETTGSPPLKILPLTNKVKNLLTLNDDLLHQNQ